MSTSADVSVELNGATVVARLRGEVDMANAAYVHDELLRSVPNDAIAMVVDLSGARYLDSAAIALLFDIAKRLGRRRQALRLVVPPASPLERVLTLTEVHSVAPIHVSLESALSG